LLLLAAVAVGEIFMVVDLLAVVALVVLELQKQAVFYH
jgi:hypothetical protein